MKKLLILASSVMLFSCGNDKKAGDFGKPAEVAPVAEAAKPSLGEELFNGKGTCHTCHKPNEKAIGPSLKEIATIYKEKGGDMVAFLKGNAEPIVDPTQYEVMKANFTITKAMTDEELKALEEYYLSFQ